MQKINEILQTVEDNLSEKERQYFWTHSVRYSRIILQIERIAKGKKLTLLDIGCFPYHVGKALELLGHTVYGISSYHEPITSKRIVVLNIENEKFPFKTNFFDIVLCNEVIEHLPQSPILMLREIYRVTKKGGILMVTTPNIARSINRGKLLIGKSIMYPPSVYFEEDGKGNTLYHRHNREYTLKELQILFRKTDWHIDTETYFISYTPFRKRLLPDSSLLVCGKYLNFLLMQLYPPLQDTLLILGKK